MSVTKGRVLRASDVSDRARAVAGPVVSGVRTRQRIPRDEVAAREEAQEIVRAAEAKAAALVEETRKNADEIATRRAAEAYAQEAAKFAAMYVALRAEDERRAERDQERAIGLAVALAERLVGESLRLDPSRVASLAKRALAEARGARKVLIEAHPDDAAALREHLALLGMPQGAVAITEASTLARGDLSLHTDLGTLHARITPQLERLAQALRDALRPG